MSALDFAARGLAAAARASEPRLFAALADAPVPADVSRIESAGHAAPGFGIASYVCDGRADPALAAAHPAACFRVADGRTFRLAGAEDGFVTPEMFGCPAGAPGVNQQPHIQAAIDYCIAVGLKGVRFTQPRYELWCPQRTGYAAGQGYDPLNHSGNFMVIAPGGAIALRGMNASRTILDCKGPSGGNLLDDYQVVPVSSYGGDCIWRGAAIKLCGTATPWTARLPDAQLAHIDVRDLAIRTGIKAAINSDWPALAATHPSYTPARVNCWDISNKCIYSQQDRQVGNFHFENCEFSGWLGEAMYLPGAGNSPDRTVGSEVVIRNCVVRETNGQALNPGGPVRFEVDGFFAENCIAGWEGLAGNNTRIVNARFRNCRTAGVAGGDGFATPLRADGSLPVCEIDITCENCGDFMLGSFVQGRLTLVDTSLTLQAFNQFGSISEVRNTTVDVTTTVHAKSVSWALRFAGLATAGSKHVANNSIRLQAKRSKEAVAAGHAFGALLNQAYSLGDNNVAYLRGHANGIGGLTGITDRTVSVIDEGIVMGGNGFGTSFDPTTTSSPEMGSGFMRAAVFSGSTTYNNVNLPSPSSYNHGSEIVVYNLENSAGKLMALRDSGVERALVGFKNQARFRCNRLTGQWDLVNPVLPQKATASIDIASTALGAESGPYTVPASGCRAWHRADAGISQSGTMPAGFAIARVRPRTDAIDIWVRNVDGANPADPAAANFTARWWIDPG